MADRIRMGLHDRMKRVYKQKGVNLSFQLDNAVEECLEKHYPDVK